MKLRTKRERRVRDNLKRAGVWLFLLVFIVSIAGVTFITVATR